MGIPETDTLTVTDKLNMDLPNTQYRRKQITNRVNSTHREGGPYKPIRIGKGKLVIIENSKQRHHTSYG